MRKKITDSLALIHSLDADADDADDATKRYKKRKKKRGN